MAAFPLGSWPLMLSVGRPVITALTKRPAVTSTLGLTASDVIPHQLNPTTSQSARVVFRLMRHSSGLHHRRQTSRPPVSQPQCLPAVGELMTSDGPTPLPRRTWEMAEDEPLVEDGGRKEEGELLASQTPNKSPIGQKIARPVRVPSSCAGSMSMLIGSRKRRCDAFSPLTPRKEPPDSVVG